MTKNIHKDIDPEDIFIDAENIAEVNRDQFEGRLEQAISPKTYILLASVCILIGVIFLGRVWVLQIARGDSYRQQSENNRLHQTILFADRGVIVDRTGRELVTNIPNPKESSEIESSFPLRMYTDAKGLAHVLGYVSYPQKDSAGFYFQEEIEGRDGVELFYDALLHGQNGKRIIETNVRGEHISESLIQEPIPGDLLQLSIDARVQEKLYTTMEELAVDVGFEGGASVLLDVHNGEVLALTSFPEYDIELLLSGDDEEALNLQLTDPRNPFLNRAISGLYTPGSVVKPFVAVGALDKQVITPEKEIVSTGELVVPNPFNPRLPTIFKDWKAHGAVDIRRALAVSSNVYFFQIGGGFEKQKGIEIEGIEEYVKLFGIGESVDIDLPSEIDGIIPNPVWKEEHFPGDPWRIGDTYNTSIGQYGFQTTPIQMARAVALLANGGLMINPHLHQRNGPTHRVSVNISDEILEIVRSGMRDAVLEGTAQGLNMPDVTIAAKTGTAELGSSKDNVNSWIVGFFPYENPRYAFATVMERGPATNLVGSLFVMRRLFEWMQRETPEYFFDTE